MTSSRFEYSIPPARDAVAYILACHPAGVELRDSDIVDVLYALDGILCVFGPHTFRPRAVWCYSPTEFLLSVARYGASTSARFVNVPRADLLRHFKLKEDPASDIERARAKKSLGN